jgi:hypothetical protein
MTTIIYDNGVLYGDTRAYSGDKTPMGSKSKVHKVKNGIFGGTSTNVGATERLRALLEEHGTSHAFETPLDVDAFYVEQNSIIGEQLRYTLWGYFSGPTWVKLDKTQTLFIGSGGHFAMGAHAAGKSAKEALEIACSLDLWSALPIEQVGL